MAILLALILALASVDEPQSAPVLPAPPDPPRNFLKGAAESRAVCEAQREKDEIVVCGRSDPDRFRLKQNAEDDRRYAEKPVRAETQVFGSGTLKAQGEKAGVGGFVSNRAKVTLSLPF